MRSESWGRVLLAGTDVLAFTEGLIPRSAPVAMVAMMSGDELGLYTFGCDLNLAQGTSLVKSPSRSSWTHLIGSRRSSVSKLTHWYKKSQALQVKFLGSHLSATKTDRETTTQSLIC
jgi:hypothetical protein